MAHLKIVKIIDVYYWACKKNGITLIKDLHLKAFMLMLGSSFFSDFSHCGDDGVYAKIKKATGLGFAPYIYHGLEYDLNKNISIEGGFILPLILVATIQFHF
ncbi:hypothetical protein [Abyssogena phaseoliformis symbiont]|uniref:hypothetical protein n=1 Tax=Abyssogena phaseoliformis symbiont TaxID=596095 RepID=UPI0019168E9D|nr:hypothetical protein [Abyssogena phaseoliformis symbiont]